MQIILYDVAQELHGDVHVISYHAGVHTRTPYDKWASAEYEQNNSVVVERF